MQPSAGRRRCVYITLAYINAAAARRFEGQTIADPEYLQLYSTL
jgi:hypothetical protein